MRRPNNCSIPSCWRTAVGLVWLDGQQESAHVMCEFHRAQHQEYAAAEARAHHEELWPERIVAPPPEEPLPEAPTPTPTPKPTKPKPKPKPTKPTRKRSYAETIELVEQLKHLPADEAAAQAGVAVKTWRGWVSRHRACKARKDRPRLQVSAVLSRLTDDELVELIQNTPKQKRSAGLRREAVRRWGELTNRAASSKLGIDESSWRKWKLQAGWNPKKPSKLPPLPSTPADEASLRAMSDEDLQSLICTTKINERLDAWRAEAVRRWGHLPNAQAAKLLGMSPRGWRNWVNAAQVVEPAQQQQEERMSDSKTADEPQRREEERGQVLAARDADADAARKQQADDEPGDAIESSTPVGVAWVIEQLRQWSAPWRGPAGELPAHVSRLEAAIGELGDYAEALERQLKGAMPRAQHEEMLAAVDRQHQAERTQLEAEVRELKSQRMNLNKRLNAVIGERDAAREALRLGSGSSGQRDAEVQRVHAEAQELARHVSKLDRSLNEVIAERDRLRARLEARERTAPAAPDRSQELQRLHAEAGRLTMQLASAQKEAEEARRVAVALHDVLTDLVATLPAEPVRDALLRRLLVRP